MHLDTAGIYKMKRFISVITIAIILSLVGVSRGQVCAPETSNDWTGLNVIVENGNDPVATPPGGISTFIMTGQGSTNCYGVIAEWRAEVQGGCGAVVDGDIDFEVWRTDGGGYRLVGFNRLYTADCEEVTPGGPEIRLRIPDNARLPIEDNNFIGWSWGKIGPGIREVTTGTTYEVDCEGVNAGGTCGGGGNNPGNPVLEARLVQGPAPTIDNLDSVIEVYENDPFVLVPLFTVLASHPSSQAREADGTAIVDPARAVLFTFTTAGTATEFTFTPGANNIGELGVDAVMPYDFETTSQYLITITVTAMGQTDTGLLTVNILDKNEAHDINLDSSTTASVQDPTCQINPIFTVTYSDEDAPLKFPAKKFYILGSTPVPPVGSNLPFRIHEDDGTVFCTAELATWTTAMGNQFILDVSVTDGLHSVKRKLTVDIVPTHDPPTIDNLPATHLILEDLAVPTIIFDVDASGSFPADIRFSMDDVQPREYFNYFSIDEITGEVSLTSDAVLDYVLQPPTPSFNITVGVRDSLQSGASDNLEIDLIWVNQKPFYSPKEYFVTIPEHCNYESPCNNTMPYTWEIPNLTLNIIDRDYDNGLPTTAPPGPDELTCDILPSFGSSYFTHHHTLFPPPKDCSKIYQQFSIDIDDFPENQQINLTVFVKDRQGVADNAKGDVATIYITITDLNDNNPVFTNPPYTATIAENTPGGVSLFTVTATDKDHGLFGEVSYSLLDDDSCDTPPPTYIDTDATLHFEIDEKSGLVQTKQFVNYEALSPKFICFLIVATDGGGRSSTTQGIVTITNVNDVRPKWECNTATLREFNSEYVAGSPCFYNDELRPDVLIDYHVLTILSTDGDSANNGITYHLLQPSNYFSLGEVNGEVRVYNYLDTYVKYILYCYSQDHGSPSLQSQPHLRVRLDTYNPKRQLVNIVIEMLELAFDQTQQAIFLVELRKVLDPWFPKIEITHYYPDKSVVSIYALRDNSTFDEVNLPKAKQFVDRDELLDVLRKDLHGTPKDVLLTPEFDPFGVILVEPTYPVWLVDTIPGIITLTLICLLLLALLLGLILGLCSRYDKCCFKKKPKYPKKQWPPEEKKPMKNDDYDRLSNHSADDRPLPRERRGSIDTIHSLIYNPR